MLRNTGVGERGGGEAEEEEGRDYRHKSMCEITKHVTTGLAEVRSTACDAVNRKPDLACSPT